MSRVQLESDDSDSSAGSPERQAVSRTSSQSVIESVDPRALRSQTSASLRSATHQAARAPAQLEASSDDWDAPDSEDDVDLYGRPVARTASSSSEHENADLEEAGTLASGHGAPREQQEQRRRRTRAASGSVRALQSLAAARRRRADVQNATVEHARSPTSPQRKRVHRDQSTSAELAEPKHSKLWKYREAHSTLNRTSRFIPEHSAYNHDLREVEDLAGFIASDDEEARARPHRLLLPDSDSENEAAPGPNINASQPPVPGMPSFSTDSDSDQGSDDPAMMTILLQRNLNLAVPSLCLVFGAGSSNVKDSNPRQIERVRRSLQGPLASDDDASSSSSTVAAISDDEDAACVAAARLFDEPRRGSQSQAVPHADQRVSEEDFFVNSDEEGEGDGTHRHFECPCQHDAPYMGRRLFCRQELCRRMQHAACFNRPERRDRSLPPHICHVCTKVVPEVPADRTALWTAVEHDDLNEVTKLLNQQRVPADICSYDHDGMTAVMLAARRDNWPISRVSRVDLNNWTILHHVIATDADRVLQHLLDVVMAGREPLNQPQFKERLDGSNLLHHCAAYNALQCWAVMLRYARLKQAMGAWVDKPDHEGMTPLFTALRAGHLTMAQKLWPRSVATRDSTDAHRRTALHLAAEGGNAECVRLVLDASSSDVLESRDAMGFTPLMVAAQVGAEAALECLIAAGAQVEAFDHEGTSALHVAALGGHTAAPLRERAIAILKTISTTERYFRFLNDLVRQHPAMLDTDLHFLLYQRGLLDLDVKTAWLRRKVQNEMPRSLAQVQAARLSPTKHPKNIHLKVAFVGEAGICLGPLRELFSVLPDSILTDTKLLTAATENNPRLVPTYFLNEHGACEAARPDSNARTAQFRALGTLLGLAILHQQTVNLPLALHVLAEMLSDPVEPNIDSLETLDGDLGRNLRWLLNRSIDDLDLDLGYSVSVPPCAGAAPIEIELSRDHASVTDANKKGYVQAVAQFHLVDKTSCEVRDLREGFQSVLPPDLLMPFTAGELALTLEGVATIDVQAWQRHTSYSNEYDANHQVIRWFWQLVTTLSDAEKSLLLQFVTGVTRLPPGGFADLRALGGGSGMTITRGGDVRHLPGASTCFNLLKLPPYPTPAILRQKVLIAIRHGAHGFSFS
ncbi:uncharacterized protein MONBRDRAFT_25338 [Monosiga brevicollis MX1]|uniref:E3 ubiquitin-protein ligase HACE1 n=1 Tax=Monosiga brevicollis TaxID=81824 RepID=A9UZ45_MONBE|nr:uncharacterized protein MONBRDRAFT_25338 [Monosiga brevicollis MX1]EDQ89721.1 predicted protein [Monosiga brevicollis MX1]|eukprot:XP_001745750.1 hypothetical protein [Monosiga brevicollis MX1]